MIIIARLGGIEIIADDERTDQTPTPEWCEDMAIRVARVAKNTYLELPDGPHLTRTMTDTERDAPYRCAHGQWHVVPSLARQCRGHHG